MDNRSYSNMPDKLPVFTDSSHLVSSYAASVGLLSHPVYLYLLVPLSQSQGAVRQDTGGR